MKKLIFIWLLSVSSALLAQNNVINITPACVDFENGTLSGWQVSNTLSTIITEGSNHYIQTTDVGGASLFFMTDKPLVGNWSALITNGCGSLCFDVNFLYAGNPFNGVYPPTTFTPYISISGGGYSAAFIVSNPISIGSGWHSYCAPLAGQNPDGTLPSNMNGHWVMTLGTNAGWNTLLNNVTRIVLPVDPTSYQSEKFGYDNICIRNTGDCNAPGSICGIKFNDINGDGRQNPGEAGIPDWEITLTGPLTLTITTNADGSYCFQGLPVGTYTITETAQEPWQQTFPKSPGTYTIQLAAGENIEGRSFGNMLPSGACTSFCNGDFEDLQVVNGGNIGFFNHSQVPCWNTTKSDGLMEIWSSGTGANSITAYTGNQCIRLDGTNAPGSLLYQDFYSGAGGPVTISFADYAKPSAMSLGGITQVYIRPSVPSNGTPELLGTFQAVPQWTVHSVQDTLDFNTHYVLIFKCNGPSPYGTGNFIDAVKVSCPSVDPLGSICDTLRANAAKSAAGDCCWSLNLVHPTNTSGITGIQFSCLTPNSFVSGSSQLGSGYTSGWLFGTNDANHFNIKRQSGNIPAGSLNNFFNFCLNKLSNPQYVVVNWLNARDSVLCSDTVSLNCDIPCVTFNRQELLCGDNNSYSLKYSFTNNATFAINNIEVAQTIPAGILVTPSTLAIASVNTGLTSGPHTFTVNGATPNTSAMIIFRFTSTDGCCSCQDTLKLTFPSCMCEQIGSSLKQDPDNCCSTLDITNSYSGNYFTNINLTALTPGTIFSTWNTYTTTGWYSQNTFAANSVQLVNITNGFIPSGSSPGILNFCLTGYTTTPQKILVEWIANDSVQCRDTLITTCIPPPPVTSCVQFIDGSLVCLANGSYEYKFKVKNNSSHTSTGFQLNTLSPLLWSFTPNNFSTISIAPNMTSTEQTVIVNGINPNSPFCFQIGLYEHIYSNGELQYSWCCHSDTVCLTTPECETQNDTCNYLCNTDFEDNQVVDPGGQDFFNQDSIPCWKSTADRTIEVWGNGFQNVPAFSGNQFIELNAKKVGTLYQNFNSGAGGLVLVSCEHRGRAGYSDVMNISIGPINPADGITTVFGPFTAVDTQWTLQSVQYMLLPNINYVISFISLPVGSPIAGGNFLDDIKVVCLSTGCVDAPSDMVAWWALDETTGQTSRDFAGLNNLGTFTNGPIPTSGKVLGGLLLDGNNDYVLVPNQAELNFGRNDFSFDAWILTGDRTGVKDIVDKRVSGYTGYCFFLTDGKLSLELATGSYTNYVSPFFVADGKWHHIGVTVSRASKEGIIFYLDGVDAKFGDPTAHQASLDNDSPLRIGSQSFADGFMLKGILDEIELFNRVLTKAEMVSIFAADTAGKCKKNVSGIEEVTGNISQQIHVYPNPASTVLFVEFNNFINEKAVLRIHNILGEELISKQIETGATNIDVSDLPNGTYVVSVTMNSLQFKRTTLIIAK